MAKGGIARAKMMILREANRVHHRLNSLPATSQHDYDYSNNHNNQLKKSSRNSIDEGKTDNSSCWIPDPRTGIYVPKGQEWMMDNVAEGAASLNQTCWLRNVDGVDKPDPDVFSEP
ncbi:hypothetical protein JCGZ_16301 [Jatropha curcas]|uniref:Uncharacterized protein n=2 Tax=Jatropha curcas TaxID=180498 RepID=A0A067LB54_JATCU|nr:hypothetical protein JCGZ_16301 [Jatropha curcas]